MEWIILLIIIAGLGFWAVKIYNTLVSYKTQYENGFAQIDVQLKRRLDLIPNLVDVAKRYMEHEQDTLLKVTEARSEMAQALKQAEKMPGSAAAMKQLGTAEATLTDAMAGFNIRVEAYPELKANENMQQLSEELVSTENRIAYARQGFNDLVQKFNEYRKSFPPIFIAPMLGFKEDAALLEFSESREELNTAPKDLFGS